MYRQLLSGSKFDLFNLFCNGIASMHQDYAADSVKDLTVIKPGSLPRSRRRCCTRCCARRNRSVFCDDIGKVFLGEIYFFITGGEGQLCFRRCKRSTVIDLFRGPAPGGQRCGIDSQLS